MTKETHKLQADMDNIKDQLKKIPTRQEMRADNLELVNAVLKKCDERYASKITEKAVFLVGSVVILFVLNQVLELL